MVAPALRRRGRTRCPASSSAAVRFRRTADGAELVGADIELDPVSRITWVFDLLLKSDVRYRFVIDMATLKSGEIGERIPAESTGGEPLVNRFRVSTLFARKLAEPAVSPAGVPGDAGLPVGLFDPERILVSTEELRVTGRSDEDAHSFLRAFHGWEGSSPGEWRARHSAAS